MSRRASRSSLLAVLTASGLVSSSGCAPPGGAPVVEVPAPSVGTAPARPAAPASSPSSALPASGALVLGIRDADGAPVVGRAVRGVAGRGAGRIGATDEEGGVFLEDVRSPFDVLVEGAPPTAVMGLTRGSVALVLDERDPSPPPPPERLRVAVLVPEGFGVADVRAASSSLHGRGAAVQTGATGGDVVMLEVEHAFMRAWTSPRERARLRVLVRDARGGVAAYAEVDAGEVAAGDVRDLGTVGLTSIAMRPETVEVNASRIPPAWSRGAAVELAFDDGARVELGEGEGEVLGVDVPAWPGARLCVRAWAERPAGTGPDLHAGARPRAGAPRAGPLPPGAHAAAPAPAAPPPGEGLARRGAGLRFAPEGSVPCARDARLVDEAHGHVVVRVVTSAVEVPFSRLSRLGAPPLALGAAVLDLGVAFGASPEEALADVDESLEVARTSRRIRFVVTP